jgi:hypothetical protein
VRLQLKRLLAPVTAAAALALPARAADNPTEASTRLTYFQEPSTQNQGIKVVHPQVDVSAPLGGGAGVAAGWEADAVTGATPGVFGPHTGVDAVTGATTFSDFRQLAHGGLSYDRPDAGIAASYAYGWEHDYRSQSVSVTTHDDLYDHNFTLALSYTHNWDRVCDANNAAAASPLDLHPLTSSAHCFAAGATDVVSHRLSIDAVEPSLSWTMTPRLVVQGGGTIQLLDGFQSNPYRRVLVGSQHQEPQEHEPTYRQRYAVFARAAYALPDWKASVLMMARLYQDSWALQAVTGDIQVNKYLAPWALLTVHGHYHVQSGASFYRDGQGYRVNGPAGQYWTGDRELSPMRNMLIGGRIAFLRRPQQERSSWFAEMEADVKYELLRYQLDSVDAPNADRPYAHILQGAFALRF